MALPVLLATLTLSAAAPLADLKRGYQAFEAGEYAKAASLLGPLPGRLPRVRDYVLYYCRRRASSSRGGRPRRASCSSSWRRRKDSRFAALAPWRVADCLWAEGRKTEAADAYRKLLGEPPAGVDAVVARFRLAETGAHGPRQRRCSGASTPSTLPTRWPRRRPAGSRLGRRPRRQEARRTRARSCSGRRGWWRAGRFDEAIAELEPLPADLPAKLKAERDFELGMAKYRTRHDYPEAAALLLGVAPRLPGEQAAFAAFHAARALARAGRTDEAIAAARAGGRAIPGLALGGRGPVSRRLARVQPRRATARRCPAWRPRSSAIAGLRFADDAAWYLALAHHFLGQPRPGAVALDGVRPAGGRRRRGRPRVAYWRGRFLVASGSTDEGMGRLARTW